MNEQSPQETTQGSYENDANHNFLFFQTNISVIAVTQFSTLNSGSRTPDPVLFSVQHSADSASYGHFLISKCCSRAWICRFGSSRVQGSGRRQD